MMPAARRAAALCLVAEHGLSQRPCRLIEVDPKTVRRRPAADAPEVRRRLRELAGQRRRFGYRRLGILLAREGMTMNRKRLLRLYREEGLRRMPERGGLHRPRRGPRRHRALAPGLQPRPPPLRPWRADPRGGLHPIRGRPAARTRNAPPFARYHRGRTGAINPTGLSLSLRARRGAGQLIAPAGDSACWGGRFG